MVTIIRNGVPNDVERCTWTVIRNGQAIAPFSSADDAAEFCRSWFTVGTAEICPTVSPRRCDEAIEALLGPKAD